MECVGELFFFFFFNINSFGCNEFVLFTEMLVSFLDTLLLPQTENANRYWVMIIEKKWKKKKKMTKQNNMKWYSVYGWISMCLAIDWWFWCDFYFWNVNRRSVAITIMYKKQPFRSQTCVVWLFSFIYFWRLMHDEIESDRRRKLRYIFDWRFFSDDEMEEEKKKRSFGPDLM